MKDRAEARTLAADAYAAIHRAIRSGSLKPGQRLRFAELQALCGMSVSPVREALVRLTAEGFTVSDDHRGFSVSPLSVEELLDIVNARKLLEGEALRLSIEHGDAEWEGHLLAAHHLMARLPRERDDLPTAMREDWEQRHADFHRILISACGSPILIELCGKLFVRADRYRRMSVSVPKQNRDVVREHERIMTCAIERKAEEAVEALRDHYQQTADAVERLFQTEEAL
ncbi:GntR family transcriptional regulator [Azospirillum picis]|uniref:DNA-binding GntR family transcriptional regulator n=1 Tax=Azospirillum picis TaxID=488438 RepID=A0ABU0MHY8_9PROT|nr:GntR family transcriptional regulator [Azospirillum picis]MBP2298835.1 DNA-binding GntR family transcriptional regulator [Azospirillum picis]MDQ0532923.1 DNA-binding GntR family transcriptional regulator [Azospirillum picis]